MFSAKQWAAIKLLLEHKTSKQIARELGISPHTVDQRLATAMRYAGAKNRRELAQFFEVFAARPWSADRVALRMNVPEVAPMLPPSRRATETILAIVSGLIVLAIIVPPIVAWLLG